MVIKTGYFAYTNKYMEAGYLPVSIALYAPNWFDGTKTLGLSPTRETFRAYKDGKLSVEEFKERYLAELNLEVLDTYVKSWEEICSSEEIGVKGIVLMCFEKSGDVCHRHFLAEVLNDRYSLGVEEFLL